MPKFEEGTDVLVHYYPGKGCSGTQSTRYIAAGDEVTLPNGEKAKTNYPGIPLFSGDRFYFPIMKEIQTNPGYNFIAKTIHWFKCIPSFIKHYANGVKITRGYKSANDNTTYDGFAIDSSLSSLGQNTDIDEIAKSNNEIKNNPTLANKARVYFGVSRGGAGTFSGLGKVPIDQDIKLCILEGAPSSLSGLFKNQGQRYFNSRAFGKWIYQHFSTLFLGKQHNTDKRYQARHHVSQFPNHIPLLIISSKKDKLVPHENTIRLALRVAEKRKRAIEVDHEQNVAPVYFVQLDQVDHNDYTTNGSKDSTRYLYACHAILRKHQISYIEEYANKGESELRAASLLSPAYDRFMKLQSDFWIKDESTAERRQQCRIDANNYLAELSDSDEETNRIKSVMREAPLLSKTIPGRRGKN